MNPLVYLEILRPGKDLAAGWEGAGERLLPRVDPHVVHQLVLGLKSLLIPGTVLPVAAVVAVLRTAHVIHRQVVHHIVQRMKGPAAHLLRVLILPHADGLLLHWLPHVAVVGRHVAAVAGRGHAAVVVAGRRHVVQAERVDVSGSAARRGGRRSVEAGGKHGVGGGGRVGHVTPEQQVSRVGGHGGGRLAVGLVVARKWLHLERGGFRHNHFRGSFSPHVTRVDFQKFN